jgi:predicted enzyme related to lactoylglutathione lyase
MFATTDAFSSFAVDDLDAARAFYSDTLGIEVVVEEMGFLTLRLTGGARPTMVYPKPDFRPANYTVLNFAVDDIDAAVDALTGNGVEMTRYDGFDQDERGIMRGNGPSIAWFTDPAGNILAVVQEA